MRLFNTTRTWLAKRRTAAELSRLSNEALTDIGISRHQIATIADRLSR